MNIQFWTSLTAILGALGVGAGAFGAHGLKTVLDAYSMTIYEKAVWYQFVHIGALFVVVVLTKLAILSEVWGCRSAICFLVGIILFSGSLYALAFTQVKALGAITPIGGTLFIAGWLCIAWGAVRS